MEEVCQAVREVPVQRRRGARTLVRGGHDLNREDMPLRVKMGAYHQGVRKLTLWMRRLSRLERQNPCQAKDARGAASRPPHHRPEEGPGGASSCRRMSYSPASAYHDRLSGRKTSVSGGGRCRSISIARTGTASGRPSLRVSNVA
jgi:hypothetical protein